MITLSIIQEAQNKDVCAQRIVFDCYGKMLFRLARRYIPDTVKAEDAVAEAVFVIFQKMHLCHFVAIPPFEMWMKRIVVNECLKILKREKRFELITDAEDDVCYVDDATIENLSAEEIFRVIEALPAGYRTVFNLYEIEGYSHAEIAELLGISTGTSKSQLSKAKSLLQKRIIEMDPVYAKRKVV